MVALTQIRTLVRKDLLQLGRNKSFIYNILFTILFNLLVPFIYTFQVRNIDVAVVDNDRSELSIAIISNIQQTGQFKFKGLYFSHDDAMSGMKHGRIDCILEIPNNFENGFVLSLSGKSAPPHSMHLSINAINTTKAIPASQYVSGSVAQTIRKYAEDRCVYISQANDNITVTNLYNQFNDYKRVMLPILFLNIMMIFNTASRLMANEYQSGTIDQINVSPMNRLIMMGSKLITCSVVDIAAILMSLVSLWLVFGFFPEGNILLMLLAILLYIISSTSMALIVCNFLDNAAQMILFSSIIALLAQLMSGLLTPLECMADWLQTLSHAIPARYVIIILRNIGLKGAGMRDLGMEFIWLVGLSLAYFTISVLTYRKTHS